MKKRILIILPYVPYPLKSGGQIAVFEMINYLRDRFSITIVIPYSESIAELKIIWPNVNIYSFSRELKYRVIQKLSGYGFDFFLKCYTSLLKSSKIEIFKKDAYFMDVDIDLINLVNNLIREFEFDFVQIEFYEHLPLICFLPDNITSIFVHHEIRYVRDQRILDLLKGGDYLFGNYFLTQTKGQEIEILKKYSKIVTVSENDKKVLSKDINPAKIFASPLTLKSGSVSSAGSYTFEDKIFFLGGSDHNANVNALEWFLDECWKKIHSERPNLNLVVIGAWSEKRKSKIISINKGVIFCGFVKDLGSVFKNGILIVPIRIGSGMRMKIIDSVNYGIPFVTTSFGVEGLDFRDSKDCFIADLPQDFLMKLYQLVDSNELQKSFVKNAQLVLNEYYSNKKLLSIRESIYLS